MTSHQTVKPATDLRPGDFCADDLTEWARVDEIAHGTDGVRVRWTLANGRTETTTYAPSDLFTLYAGMTL